MKFVGDRPFSDPAVAARKLVEIANAVNAVPDARICVELINLPFLRAGGMRFGVAAFTRFASEGWWAVRGSNSRHPVCKTDALPLS